MVCDELFSLKLDIVMYIIFTLSFKVNFINNH